MSEAAATRDRAIDKVFTAVIDDHKLVDKSPDSTMAQSLTSVVDAGGVISRDLLYPGLYGSHTRFGQVCLGRANNQQIRPNIL